MMCIIIPLMIMNIIYNSVSGSWAAYDIILRIAGLLIYALVIYFYKQVFKSDIFLWIFTLAVAFIILVENLSMVFGQKLSV